MSAFIFDERFMDDKNGIRGEMFCRSSQMILFSCSLLEGIYCSTFSFEFDSSQGTN